MVCCLTQSLPQLQLLEVGLCKHPELVRAAVVGGGADQGSGSEGSWAVVHPGFVEVPGLCSIINSKLQVKLGYAHQWL